MEEIQGILLILAGLFSLWFLYGKFIKKYLNMDFDIIFQKKVITTYSLDKILIPKNLGSGELENVVISILRKRLDFCFVDIENSILKEKLIE